MGRSVAARPGPPECLTEAPPWAPDTGHPPFAHAGVRERRMADVVRQCQRFGQTLIQAENRCHRPGDLRYLDRVSKPIAKVIGEAERENLCLGFQPPKGASVNDAVPVALERIAIGVIELRVSAPPALRDRKP